MLILSGDDYTAKEFLECLNNDPDWKDALAHPGLLRHDLPGADHTFSTAATRAQVEVLSLNVGQAMRLLPAASRPDALARTDAQLGASAQGYIRTPV